MIDMAGGAEDNFAHFSKQKAEGRSRETAKIRGEKR
jgi:hypothetical protein